MIFLVDSGRLRGGLNCRAHNRVFINSLNAHFISVKLDNVVFFVFFLSLTLHFRVYIINVHI